MGVRIVRYAFCNEIFCETDELAGLKMAASLGYTGVEVAPFTLGSNVYAISQQKRDEYRLMAQECGLEVVGLHWLLAKTSGYHLTTNDLNVRKMTTDYMCELAGLCRDLGGKVMVLGSPMQRNFPDTMMEDEAMQNAADVLRNTVSTLVQCGVRVAVEPLGPQEGNFLNTAALGRRLIEMVGSDHVQLHLDTKAMSTEHMPIPQVIRENADIMIHFHANDPNRLGPGMGDVDQVPIFEALRSIEYSGWVSVEVFDYALGAEEILRQSIVNMRRAVAGVRD